MKHLVPLNGSGEPKPSALGKVALSKEVFGIEVTVMILEAAPAFGGWGCCARPGVWWGTLGGVGLLWESEALLVGCEHRACMCGICVTGYPYLGEASTPCICFGGPLQPKQASPGFGGVHAREGVCNHTQTPGRLGKAAL